MSVKMAALALGVATLSAATILPAAAEDFAIRPGCGDTLIGRSGCGSTGGSPDSASVGSPASTAPAGSAGGGGDAHVDYNKDVLGTPTSVSTDRWPDGTLETVTTYANGSWISTSVTTAGYVTTQSGTIAGAGATNIVGGGNGGKGTSAFMKAPPNPKEKGNAAPTAIASANVFGGAVNALNHAVSNASLGRPVSQEAPAPKKPVTVRIIPAWTQAQATAHQPVVHPQPLGPVGSSSMNARQSALSAGSR